MAGMPACVRWIFGTTAGDAAGSVGAAADVGSSTGPGTPTFSSRHSNTLWALIDSYAGRCRGGVFGRAKPTAIGRSNGRVTSKPLAGAAGPEASNGANGSVAAKSDGRSATGRCTGSSRVAASNTACGTSGRDTTGQPVPASSAPISSTCAADPRNRRLRAVHRSSALTRIRSACSGSSVQSALQPSPPSARKADWICACSVPAKPINAKCSGLSMVT